MTGNDLTVRSPLNPSAFLRSVGSIFRRHEIPVQSDDMLERAFAVNRRTWGALALLGVRAGDMLPLHFFFETAGEAADRELAAFLCCETDYDVVIEADGVTGRTRSMPVSPATLDDWVRGLVVIGHDHGFGRGRSGDVETLRRLGASDGFTVDVVRPVELGGHPVSSTHIRRAVAGVST